MRYEFLLFKSIIIIAVLCFAANLSAQADVLVEADQMPYFIGCSDFDDNPEEKRKCSNKNLIRFISNELVYPDDAKEEGIEGTVYVTFIVDESGEVQSPDVIRDIGGGCGEAALNIFKNMPKWEPAVHEGNKVKVKLNLPIYFSVKKDENNEKASLYQISWGSLARQTVSEEDLESQLEKKVIVRDSYGEDQIIGELIFVFEKRKSYWEESSNGEINEDLKKVIRKCRKGGQFSITAVIQVKGEFIFVKRTFDVI